MLETSERLELLHNHNTWSTSTFNDRNNVVFNRNDTIEIMIVNFGFSYICTH